MLSITRRVFAGLGALLPLALVAKETKDAKDDSTAAETEEVDVLVIGSGAAGLSAALAAKEAGAKRVLVIEKMPVIGGNTLVSSGVLNAPDPKAQEPLGIKDSPELFFEQTFEAGRRKANPELVRVMTEGALETKLWLQKQGMVFKEEPFQVYGGLWPRSFWPRISHGRGYVAVLSGRCAEEGIPIRTETEAVDFIKTSGGRVMGVVAQTNSRKLRIEAKSGIVVATGGFTANAALCASLDPRLEGLSFTGRPSATGEMLEVARRAGVKLVGMEDIQCNLGPEAGHAYRSGFHLEVTRYVLVNREGRRFVAEDGERDVIRDAVFAQPGREVFSIVDRDGFQGMNALFQQSSIMGKRTKDTFSAESLEELARQMGVPPGRLLETIDAFNRSVDEKRDPLGREPWMLVNRIERPPFYAARVRMCIHYTMGGIAIDGRARVLDAEGRVMPGLFAAGEVTGGVHGANRVGGNGLLGAFVYGRIAGREAAGAGRD